jgi:hypothetical protein
MAKKPIKKGKDTQSSDSFLVYQMKISLMDIRPPIWRRIEVRDDTRLDEFHYILQDIMGWTNSHIHEFLIGQRSYGDTSIDVDGDIRNEKKYTLGKLISVEKTKFGYIYDFGDNWEHLITLEKILPAQTGKSYPICLTGKRACPPDDCGGVWGYEEILEILKDPSHPEYEDTIDWIGKDFDAEKFDLQAVNSALRSSRTKTMTALARKGFI